MKKLIRRWPVAAALALFAAGIVAAVALAGTATTVTACATTPAQTIADNATPIATVPAGTACTTVTVPTVTETVTVGGTTTAPTTTTTPTPTASGGTPGIGVLNEAGKLGIVTNPGLYSMVVGGAWGSDVASVIEKVPGRGLVYFNGMDVRTSFSTGVTYTQALNNGWLLKDSAGNYLVNSTFGSYCADVGSPAYQQAWISNVEGYLAGHAGVDGIFIDNVLMDPKADCGAYPAKYPTTLAWSTATLAFAKAVYTALHARGYYVALNASSYKAGLSTYNDGTSEISWWQQLGPYADGLMNEYYDETSNTLQLRATGTASYQEWSGWQRLIPTAQAMGVDFLGLTKSSGLNTAVATYGKASFLLEWDGGGSAFIYTAGNSTDPTNTAWTTDIGQPLAAKVAVGVGYERAYTKGTVLVNPSPSSSQTFTVNGASVTLSPTTAKILPG